MGTGGMSRRNSLVSNDLWIKNILRMRARHLVNNTPSTVSFCNTFPRDVTRWYQTTCGDSVVKMIQCITLTT